MTLNYIIPSSGDSQIDRTRLGVVAFASVIGICTGYYIATTKYQRAPDAEQKLSLNWNKK